MSIDCPLWIQGDRTLDGAPPGESFPLDVEALEGGVSRASDSSRVLTVPRVGDWLEGRGLASAFAFHQADGGSENGRMLRRRFAKWVADRSSASAMTALGEPMELTPTARGVQARWHGHAVAGACLRTWPLEGGEASRVTTDDDGCAEVADGVLVAVTHVAPSSVDGADWELWVASLVLPTRAGSFRLGK